MTIWYGAYRDTPLRLMIVGGMVPRKVRELRADLRRAGFVLDPGRGKGSHTYWKHPLLPTDQATISGHDGDDAQPYQEEIVRNIVAKLREAQAAQP